MSSNQNNTKTSSTESSRNSSAITNSADAPTLEHATLGGGCFWCIESAFNQVEGIVLADSGYSGGELANPSYQQVCSGSSGHAEVVRLSYNPKVISYRDILEIYFALHDPTQLNRQGNDVGTQYRSVIFYHNDEQQLAAKQIIAEMAADQTWPAPIVTAVEPLTNYYPAEQYHKDYYNNNPNQPYCAMVVGPKLAKFKKNFASRLKNTSAA